MRSSKLLLRDFVTWFVAATFVFYQFMLRISPNVMSSYINQDFVLTAEQFSSLAFLYYISYAIMQIPAGLLTDAIGVRRTLILSIICTMCGSALFTWGFHLSFLQLGRLLIGIGSASSLICTLKVVADRFPNHLKSIFMGASLSVGTIGAVVAGRVMSWLIETNGWRSSSGIITIFGLVPLILAALFVHDLVVNQHKKEPIENALEATQIGNTAAECIRNTPVQELLRLVNNCINANSYYIKAILKHKYIMIYVFISIGLFGPLSVLADLWGCLFIQSKVSLDVMQAANTSLIIYIGLAIGSIVIPAIGKSPRVLNQIVFVCCILLSAVFCCLLYLPSQYINYPILCVILFALGFLSGAEMICFTAALWFIGDIKSRKSEDLSGKLISVVNTISMLGVSALYQIIGLLLDLRWTGTLKAGARIYSGSEFAFAMSTIVVLCIACALFSLLAHPTVSRLRNA